GNIYENGTFLEQFYGTSVAALTTDSSNNLYELVTVEGSLETIYGTHPPFSGGLNLTGLVADSSGNVYTYSAGTGRNQIIEISGGNVTSISPSGLVPGAG